MSPGSGLPKPHQYEHVSKGEKQRGREDAEHGEVLAQYDFQVCRRKRKQQFIRSLPGFLGPHAHGQRGYEEEQQVGEQGVQLVEIRQVVQKELDLPESGSRAEEDEQGDEDVSRGIAERHAHVPPDDGRHHLAVEPACRGRGSFARLRAVRRPFFPFPRFLPPPSLGHARSTRRTIPPACRPCEGSRVCRRRPACLR